MSEEFNSPTGDGSLSVCRDGGILRLTLDRPLRHNSLSPAMIGTFIAALTEAAVDDSLRAIHVRGAGNDFCTGADWVAAEGGEWSRVGGLVSTVSDTAHRMIQLLHDIHLPVVCGVRGRAVGLGCGLALAADFTVAATDAVFWEPSAVHGVSPDSASTWLLPRLVGLTRARQMLLLGDQISATVAADWGLIYRVVTETELDDAVEDLLTRLASDPTLAIGLAKQAIHYGQHATLSQSMTRELFNLELSVETGESKVGPAASHRRRTPDLHGQ